MECCSCDKYLTDSDDEIYPDEFSLISFSYKDVAQLKIIGEMFINYKRYHACDNYIYDDTQTQVGIIIHQNIIAWY